MSGGGGAKKVVINFLVDHPAKAYLGGAAFVWLYRKYEVAQQYNTWFGKFDFERKVEKNELH